MRVVYGTKDLKKGVLPSIVTIGVFDGVHTGHRKVISQLLKDAKRHRLKPAVITFNPHPARVLKNRGRVPMLTSLRHRLRLLEGLGIEVCLVINFTRAFAEKPAEDFLRDTLLKRLNMKMLVIGNRFSFGKEQIRSGVELENIASNLRFSLKVIKPERYHGVAISSSMIRALIEEGRLTAASRLLARPVSVLGTVIHGKKRGRIIGFKTANIDPHHEAIPPSGVYATYAKIGKNRYKSVLNIGRRPTFNEREPGIEVHIFGINKNIYNREVEVSFVKKIRPERKFRSREALRSQIAKDCIAAKRLLCQQKTHLFY